MTSRTSLALLFLLAAPVVAQEEKQQGPEQANLTFTFKRASIQAFMGYLSREGGFTFVEESAVQGDITAIAEKPLTRSQALEVLRAWLLPKDRTLLRTGDVVRILTLEEAKRRGLPVRVGSDPKQINDNDELVTQVMPLRYVQASEVKSQLEGLLSDQGTLMIEGTSNALVVRDTSASIRRFAQVLEALDQAVSSELEVKVYRLENANAEEVSKIITELFAGQSGGSSGGNARNNRGRNNRGRGGRNQNQGGGMREMARMFFSRGGGSSGGASRGGGAGSAPVLVSTDPRTNAVVVTATTDQLGLIDSLIEELDKDPDPIVTEIRPFALENADAESLAETLRALFDEQSTTTGGRQQQNNQGGVPRWVRRMMGNNAGGGATQSTSDRYSPTPKFTTDERTNTLIVSAVTSDLDMIGVLVARLDKDPTEAMAVLVTPLRHASAANLAQILTDSLSGSASSGGGNANTRNNNRGGGNNNRNNRGGGNNRNNQQASSGSSNASGLVGDVTVVADEEANSLVFTTSQRNFSRIRTIVKTLDQPRREVFIECLIAEVRLTDKSDLGIQWNAMFTNSAENNKTGTQEAGTDFGLGALGDGLRYTTSSADLTGLLRALKTEGRLTILSSPKILCLENQDAEISVGQEVPFVTNSRITQNGDTVNTIQYRDVGIILRVTPQINAAGHVRMTVHPEVSSIAPESESVTITDGVRSPTFNRNFADTTIVVASGETAVSGGLIHTSTSETEVMIPFVGDIPILGRLFKSTISDTVRQEIVVFLTPHVVEDAGQLRARTRKTLGEYAMVPTQVIHDELARWLRGLDEKSHAYHYNKGTVLLEGGRIAQAITALEKATALKSDDAASHLNLGLALARAGRLEKAKAALRRASRLDPFDPEIPYNLGAIFWRQDDFPQATEHFKRALLIDDEHEASLRWLMRAVSNKQRIERELLEDDDAKPSEPKGKN